MLIVPTSVAQLIAAGALVISSVFNVLLRTSRTYVLFNEKTGQVYIGRKSGFGKPINILKRRMYAHPYKVLGFGNPMIDKAMQGTKGYRAIRGREQQLIDSYGGIDSSYKNCPKIAYFSFLLVPKMFFFVSSFFRPERA